MNTVAGRDRRQPRPTVMLRTTKRFQEERRNCAKVKKLNAGKAQPPEGGRDRAVVVLDQPTESTLASFGVRLWRVRQRGRIRCPPSSRPYRGIAPEPIKCAPLGHCDLHEPTSADQCHGIADGNGREGVADRSEIENVNSDAPRFPGDDRTAAKLLRVNSWY